MSKEIILLTPIGMMPIHTKVFEKLKKDEKLVISELSIEQVLEKQKQLKEKTQLEEKALKRFEDALVFTKSPQIYFENPNGMTNRQMRKHEETRKRKGRK